MKSGAASTDGVFILYTSGHDPDGAEAEQIVHSAVRDTGMCFAGAEITRCHGSGDLGEAYGRFLIETYEQNKSLPHGAVDRALIRDVTVNGVRRIVVVVLKDEFHAWVRELIPRHLAHLERADHSLAVRPGFTSLDDETALSFVAGAWNGDVRRRDDAEIMVSLFADTDPGRIRKRIPGGDYTNWVTPWVEQARERGADAAHWLVCADGRVGVVHLGYFAADGSTITLPWDLLSPIEQQRVKRIPQPAGEPRPRDVPRVADIGVGSGNQIRRGETESPRREGPRAPDAGNERAQGGDRGDEIRQAGRKNPRGRGIESRHFGDVIGDLYGGRAVFSGGIEPWHVGDVIDDLYDVRAVVSGGMGVVYRVWHRGWRAELAVKTPRLELLGSPVHVRRFEEEAEAWVGLRVHPNTVTCVYVRQWRGTPRVFAEWVDGGSLAEAMATRTLYVGAEPEVLDRLLDVAIQFAWGVTHAHENGLVHQDIKPANVMLTRQGTVKVTDFGLARAYVRDDKVSQPSLRVGYSGGMTIAYCSPEQAQAAVDPAVRLSGATDVWSWAISVWELFVGEPPCRYGQTAARTFETFLADNRTVAGIPALPTGLANVLSKCFAINPDTRPTMHVLADELIELYAELTGVCYRRPRPERRSLTADWLSNHALSLLDVGSPERAEKLWQQARAADPDHPHTAYNYGLRRWRQGRITDAELIAELEAARRRGPGDPARDHFLGLVHLERGDIRAARGHLELAARAAPNEGEIAEALAHAREQDVEAEPIVFSGHDGPVGAVSISADARVVASAGADGTVRIWDIETRRCRHVFAVGDAVETMALSRDGSRVIARDAADTVTVWDAVTGRRLHRLGEIPAACIAIGAHGSIAVSGGSGPVRVWDLDCGRVLRTLREGRRHRPESDAAQSVALTADDRLVVGFYPHEEVTRVWEVGSGRLVRALDGFTDVILDADSERAVSPSVTTGTHTLTVWTVRNGRTVDTARIPPGRLAGPVALNGERLVIGGDAITGRRVEIWGFGGSGRCLRTLVGHTGRITAVASTAGGRIVVSGSRDGTLRVWHLAPPGPSAPWQLAQATITA